MIDPYGKKRIAFWSCTAVNVGKQLHDMHEAVSTISRSVESTRRLLRQVNREIAECPKENTDRLNALIQIQRDVTANLVRATSAAAANAGNAALMQVSEGIFMEGACGFLGLVLP
jgi:predicted  nucleic acid-binding Zn-ribbon protein